MTTLEELNAKVPTLAEVTERLRDEFPEASIGQKPYFTCQDCQKRQCQVHTRSWCDGCKQWITTEHGHLSFVGHAAITDRLLSVDPAWEWEPAARNPDGSPVITEHAPQGRGGSTRLVMWGTLTIAGKTRICVGTCDATQREPEKELIGDLIRNGAMRFGAGLYLWSKEELPHMVDSGGDDDERPPRGGAEPDPFPEPPVSLVREDVMRAMMGLEGSRAQAAKQGLVDAGLWPLGEIHEDQLADAALIIRTVQRG